MKKKKILYYTDCHFFAGCENMIANFLNSEELGNEFDIVLIYRYSKRYEEGVSVRINDRSNCEGIDLIVEPSKDIWVKSNNRVISFLQRIGWGLSYLFIKYVSIYKNKKKLKDVFRKYKPDIVHINNGGYPATTSAQAAVFAAHACHIDKIYYVVNNMAMGYRHPSRWLDIFVDYFVKKYVTQFVTGSRNAGNHLKKVLSIADNKQVTISNGIVQRPTTMSITEFKKLYSIPEKSLVFSTIANFEERKGHKYLIEAIKEIDREENLDNIIFLFEGEGPTKSFIKNLINKYGLENNVRLLSIPAIYDLYMASDVIILPSISNEDFPNIIIESMGMELPVIGTRIAGIPEQIIPDKTGILVEPANVIQLKAAIKKMRDDTVFRTNCGKEAKKLFQLKYTAESSVRQYIKLYNGVLN